MKAILIILFFITQGAQGAFAQDKIVASDEVEIITISRSAAKNLFHGYTSHIRGRHVTVYIPDPFSRAGTELIETILQEEVYQFIQHYKENKASLRGNIPRILRSSHDIFRKLNYSEKRAISYIERSKRRMLVEDSTGNIIIIKIR